MTYLPVTRQHQKNLTQKRILNTIHKMRSTRQLTETFTSNPKNLEALVHRKNQEHLKIIKLNTKAFFLSLRRAMGGDGTCKRKGGVGVGMEGREKEIRMREDRSRG